jgi:hypothetical protein
LFADDDAGCARARPNVPLKSTATKHRHAAITFPRQWCVDDVDSRAKSHHRIDVDPFQVLPVVCALSLSHRATDSPERRHGGRCFLRRQVILSTIRRLDAATDRIYPAEAGKSSVTARALSFRRRCGHHAALRFAPRTWGDVLERRIEHRRDDQGAFLERQPLTCRPVSLACRDALPSFSRLDDWASMQGLTRVGLEKTDSATSKPRATLCGNDTAGFDQGA